MSKNNFKILSIIFFSLFILTTIVFIITATIASIRLAEEISQSAPWYVAVIIHFVYFIGPITLEFFVYRYYSLKYKRVVVEEKTKYKE